MPDRLLYLHLGSGERFPYAHVLTRHEKAQHPRLNRCDNCGNIFTKPELLLKHMAACPPSAL